MYYKFKKHPTRYLVTVAVFALSFTLTSFATEQKAIIIDDYKAGISEQWKEKIFNKKTEYTIVKKANQTSILAISDNAASGLFYKIAYTPETYPILEWSWQISAVLPSGNARLKNGDDYAARIYVVFPSIFFWRTRALNYIWANKLPKGELCSNAYTSNNIMIAVQSGNNHAGKWMTEKRNIIADYKQAFGEQPPDVGAIAIMTDTDDTGEKTKAWYGPITIKSLFFNKTENP